MVRRAVVALLTRLDVAAPRRQARPLYCAKLLVLLPITALGVCVLAIKGRGACWREAILGGAVLWGVVLVGITEALSLVHSLTAIRLAAGWLVGVACVAVIAVRGRRDWQFPSVSSVRSLDGVYLVTVGPLVGMVLVLGAIAIISPPNTWDSMTYHMARLVHWSQNASLEPYPTHILRQLYLQPGAEFVLLHLQILSGGDHFAPLVQWASMIGVLIGTSLIASELGARRAGTLCATLFAASLPIGILESTSTQNDYVVAFWIVCVTAFAMRATRSPWPKISWATMVALGASTGLALLTKATAYLILFPILFWVSVCLIRCAGWRGFRLLVLAGTIALVINAGFFARNWLVFASPIGPLDEGAPSLRYVNEGFAPALLVSNLVRDIAVNLNATPVVAINVRTLHFVQFVHAWLGVDIADPRTTWGQEHFSEQPIGLAFDENFASNPVHVGLMVFSLAAVWPLHRVLPRASVVYALMVSGGFLLFVVALRWQPWDTRLELPFFVLAAPLVGMVVERIFRPLALVLSAVLLVSMVPWAVYNQARPLVGPRSILAFTRDQQYFTNRPSMRSAYRGAVEYLGQRDCGHIGLISTVDGWEYPLWPLLTPAVSSPVQIEHVNVTNVSAPRAGAPKSQFEPCAMVALGPTASLQSVEFDGRSYRSAWAHLDAGAVLEQVAVFSIGQ